ncbi:MAG: LPS export ABC transporter periplasmic protein LptC [Nitrospirota bacterium]|nr:MAG: LPS export ABC transporter periplasmic protein LptC [Nitrospirota bacterium]
MGSQKVRWGLTFLVLIMAIFIGHRVYTHMEKTPTPAVHSSTEIRPADAWIQGFTYRQTQAGVAKWEVLAKRARVIQAEHRAQLEDVTVHLFEKEAKQMTVEADQGTINTKTKNIELKNQKDFLSVRLNNGYTIYSKQLKWKESSRQVQSQTPVVIKGKGLTVTGIGLIGNVDEQEFQILSNVRAEVSS